MRLIIKAGVEIRIVRARDALYSVLQLNDFGKCFGWKADVFIEYAAQLARADAVMKRFFNAKVSIGRINFFQYIKETMVCSQPFMMQKFFQELLENPFFIRNVVMRIQLLM